MLRKGIEQKECCKWGDGWMGMREEREEGKEKAGEKSGRWGYDELKMTLSCSLVSKDHSVC